MTLITISQALVMSAQDNDFDNNKKDDKRILDTPKHFCLCNNGCFPVKSVLASPPPPQFSSSVCSKNNFWE